MNREEIVRHVQRQAALNSGIPLGKQRFAKATGISESAWIGRYWARWSDLLAEAGFDGNSLQTQKHSDEDLLSQLAELTVSLGHFPTRPEIQMRRRQNETFAAANTFTNRFGNRDQTVLRLFDFAVTRPEYQQLKELIEPEVANSQSAGQPRVQPSPSSPGRVYMLRNGKHYKIGKTDNLSQRINQIHLSVPGRIETVHVLETDDPGGIEHYWHKRFAAKRIEGEWFLLDVADVAAFRRRGNSM